MTMRARISAGCCTSGWKTYCEAVQTKDPRHHHKKSMRRRLTSGLCSTAASVHASTLRWEASLVTAAPRDPLPRRHHTTHMRRRLTRGLCSTAASVHASTLRWVDQCIIGINLCPFSKAVRSRSAALRCIVSAATGDEALLDEISAEAHTLAECGSGAETSLLVLPPTTAWGGALHDDFGRFVSLGHKVDERLKELAAEIDLVPGLLFHPRAREPLTRGAHAPLYSSAEEEEASDYAMRAPYPTIHLLRSSDLKALPPAAAARVVPRNKRTLSSLGVAVLREKFGALRADAGESSQM